MKRAHYAVFVSLAFLIFGKAALAVPEPGASPASTSQVEHAPQAERGGWWSESIWDDPDRPYQWYPPDPPPQQKQARKPVPPKDPDLRSIKTIEALRKEVDRLRDRAIMSGSPQDVRIFLGAQQFVLEKSSIFADVARRVVWSTPSVDYSLRHPTESMAMQNFNYSERMRQEQSVKDFEQFLVNAIELAR